MNTLPVSHYVDKVRWCLDKANVAYEEEKDIGIFWVLTTGRLVPTLRIPGKPISISNSSDILKYLYGYVKSVDEERAKFLEPSPSFSELEEKIDLMGTQVRTYVYYHVRHSFEININGFTLKSQFTIFQALVANKNADELALKVWGINEAEIPPWQKSILKVTLPILKKFLITVLNIDKEVINYF